ncbi:MAG: hypothetical protein JWQ91_1543 [Aeromicrobium sp.]|jgi:hypothetical protein|nr:hypothetical protein [Aeromicrobium sp.]
MRGVQDGGTPPDPRHRPSDPKENVMYEAKLMEWGPAHLRDEAPQLDLELTDRPDDN